MPTTVPRSPRARRGLRRRRAPAGDPTSVHIRYRGLQQFFKWAVDDGELGLPDGEHEPADGPRAAGPSDSDDDWRALKACGDGLRGPAGPGDRPFFVDTGAGAPRYAPGDRRHDFRLRQATVTGKGRRTGPSRSATSARRRSTATSGPGGSSRGPPAAPVAGPGWSAHRQRHRGDRPQASQGRWHRRADQPSSVPAHPRAHGMSDGVEGENLMQLLGWRCAHAWALRIVGRGRASAGGRPPKALPGGPALRLSDGPGGRVSFRPYIPG